MECIIMVLGLLCFDGVKSPGARNDNCTIPKELGYIACTDYPECNMHGLNLSYMSDTYVKENKVKWCEELAK